MKKQTDNRKLVKNTNDIKRLDQEKEHKELLTICSEEIGFLIGVLQGELHYLQSSKKINVAPFALAKSIDSANRILLLTRNLKVFSNENVLNTELSDLSQILLESIDQIEKGIEEKGIRLTVLLEAGSYIKGDSGALNSVFTNLVLFASHFLLKGNELHVTLKHTQNEIRIEIKDNGKFQTHTEVDTLFHPHTLRELYPSLSTLCIAPSISKLVLLRHNGNIEITNTNQGTTYFITFPFDPTQSKILSFPKQRRAKRIQSHLTCEMTGNLNSVGTGMISVISTLGAFVKLPKNKVQEIPALNQEISFLVNLFEKNSFSVSRAKIVNLHPGEDYYGLGLEFIEVEERGKIILDEIVRCSAS